MEASEKENKKVRTIVKIVGLKSWTKDKITHWKTYAVVDDGTEVEGYGKDFEVGDQVQVLHDKKWDQVKMQKGKKVK